VGFLAQETLPVKLNLFFPPLRGEKQNHGFANANPWILQSGGPEFRTPGPEPYFLFRATVPRPPHGGS